MNVKVRAKKKDGTGTIVGNYCLHGFIKKASELEENEIASVLIPYTQTTGIGAVLGGETPSGEYTPATGDSGQEYYEPQYLVTRQAVQTMDDRDEYIVNSDNDAVEVTGNMPLYTEIIADSYVMSTGMIDKNGVEIFEGDIIRYGAGYGNYEQYVVIFSDCKWTTIPEWPWGCNYSPFMQTRCEVITS